MSGVRAHENRNRSENKNVGSAPQVAMRTHAPVFFTDR